MTVWTGDRVRGLREALKLSQTDIGRLLNASSQRTIARIEAGGKVPWRMWPWLDVLSKYAEVRNNSWPPVLSQKNTPWAWFTILNLVYRRSLEAEGEEDEP